MCSKFKKAYSISKIRRENKTWKIDIGDICQGHSRKGGDTQIRGFLCRAFITMRQVRWQGSKRGARKSSSGAVMGLRLTGWGEAGVRGTERERGLCRALTGAGPYSDRQCGPKRGKEERKHLDSTLTSSLLAQPTRSQRAHVPVGIQGILKDRGQVSSGSGGPMGDIQCRGLWIVIGDSLDQEKKVEGASIWRQKEDVSPVEGSGWWENWLHWAGWAW